MAQIALEAPKRRLVVCLDGTWNEPEKRRIKDPWVEEAEVPTNVLKLARGIVPVDSRGVSQLVYYDSGVGTFSFIDRLLGGGFGIGLSGKIQRAYHFIANNYVDGDDIFLFGFSRGAYAVRSLAGFIDYAGLIDKSAGLYMLPQLYSEYRFPKKRDADLEKPRPLPIHFIGVWDTVGALGPPTPLLRLLTRRYVGFHNTMLGSHVRHAYHALP